MLDLVAQRRAFASVTTGEQLVDLYVPSDRLIGAQGDDRPEAQMMRALAADPPPRFLQVVGAAGAGKTSMILRVLADLGRREPTTLHRPHEVLVVDVGDDPERLASPARFMHTMLQLVARQNHRFASIDPEILADAAADERTVTGPQLGRRVTLDAKFASYSAELKQTYTTAKFGQDPASARQDFEDVLSIVSGSYRPVVVIDDTEHFVRRGAGGGVDVASVANLFHNAVRALAALDKVDVVVAVHPKYLDVPEVLDVTDRFAFQAIRVPVLRAESPDPGLAAILTRRLERHDIHAQLTDVITSAAVSQLEACYFAYGHNLRNVLKLADAAASAAAADTAKRIEPRHLQPLLDRTATPGT